MGAGIRDNVETDPQNQDADGGDAQRMLMKEAALAMRISSHSGISYSISAGSDGRA
jgi:hypothetical protein